jgi:hypothetical protein
MVLTSFAKLPGSRKSGVRRLQSGVEQKVKENWTKSPLFYLLY